MNALLLGSVPASYAGFEPGAKALEISQIGHLILELWSNKGGTCVRDSHAAVGTDLGVSTAATLSSGEKAAGDRVAAREQEWSQQSVFATLSIG